MLSLAALLLTAPPVLLPDPELQSQLERSIVELGLKEHVDNQVLGFALVDLTQDVDDPHYAVVNPLKMLYAASLPKIALLHTYFADYYEGREDLAWNPDVEARLKVMMTHSSNSQASWTFRQVGVEAIAAQMEDPEYLFYERPHGGLWVGRGYGGTVHHRRDPIGNHSHAASAQKVAEWYWHLARGALVSPYASERMVSLMGPPGHDHKFVGALQDRHGLEVLARKSGTWSIFHSDSALIQHHHARYILVGLVEHPEGSLWLKSLAQWADDTVMAGKHRH